ncbi:MAG: hypothetical protein EZS28_000236 [Streblomastix strix]|uniref:Uncharacterized protein n=1 Tax=Streblomastix strix TaxID=222440 RepID=A0A5J4XCK5_9EUKA|nr:MAG: hypothetical protein EZS28_000236 [Streblomastix strix]
MTVPNECNIIDGLLGLGPDILLEVLSEIDYPLDMQQFLITCIKIFKLKNHRRFLSFLDKFSPSIAIHNPDPSKIEFSDVDGVQKKITYLSGRNNTVSLTQVLENGIWSMEAQIQNAQFRCGAVGIVRDSHQFLAGSNPSDFIHKNHCIVYSGMGWGPDGSVYYKDNNNLGNEIYNSKQIVRSEYDSEKGTLIWFVDEVQQPVYITGIKEKVRFFIYMNYAGQYCIIKSLKKLLSPTSGHVQNKKVIQCVEQLKELILDESQLERTSNVFKRTMAYVMNIGGSAKLLNKIEAMKFIISRTVANVFNNHFIEMDPEFSEEIGLIVRGKMDQDQEIKEDNYEQNEQKQ